MAMPQKPYTLLSYIFSRNRVISPALPNSMIMDNDNTKGGETTGSMDTTLNSPPENLPSFT